MGAEPKSSCCGGRVDKVNIQDSKDKETLGKLCGREGRALVSMISSNYTPDYHSERVDRLASTSGTCSSFKGSSECTDAD